MTAASANEPLHAWFDQLASGRGSFCPNADGITVEDVDYDTNCNKRPMSAVGHVWTAPWQELSDVSAALVGCGHVSGLLMRPL